MKWLTTKAYLGLLGLYLFGHLIYWYTDADIPLKVTGAATVTHAAPGKQVKIIVPVERNIKKDCSVLLSRYMYDSEGTWHDLMATRFISAEGMKTRHATNPKHAQFSVKIPEDASVGPALIVTQLAYMCNPLHNIWPMDFEIKIPIVIEKP